MNHTIQIAPLGGPALASTRSRDGWWQTLVLVLLVGSLYSSILFHLAKQWSNDQNFSHGFFVPAFSLYVLWMDRAKLAKIPRAPSSWGLLVLFIGLCELSVGVLGAEIFSTRSSLLLVIAGLVIFFLGWKFFRAILFPWAFLILMVPIPTIVFSQITLPLQILASKVAAAILPVFDVPVMRIGNIIKLAAMQLEVAEACSGIRSLLSLITLSIIYGYLTETRAWIRVALAVLSIPIAIFTNSLRIVGTGILVQHWGPEKAEGFFHVFQGWLIFVVALGFLGLVHQFLRMCDHQWKSRH